MWVSVQYITQICKFFKNYLHLSAVKREMSVGVNIRRLSQFQPLFPSRLLWPSGQLKSTRDRVITQEQLWLDLSGVCGMPRTARVGFDQQE